MKAHARFPARSDSVAHVRDMVKSCLDGLPPETLDSVLVIASELASNCVRHGATAFELRLERDRRGVRVEVEDDGDGEPLARAPGPTETSGRGLQITGALSSAWGVLHMDGRRGKTVWAVIELPSSHQEITRRTRLAGDRRAQRRDGGTLRMGRPVRDPRLAFA